MVIKIGNKEYNVTEAKTESEKVKGLQGIKELPENELENVINRSRATAVIYSAKKKDAVKKIENKVFFDKVKVEEVLDDVEEEF